MTLDKFTRAYLDCALWACGIDAALDADIPPELVAEAIEDCKAFQEANAADLAGADLERSGHDFYLTRERHGAGYWDGDYHDDVGRRLTEAAHTYGSWDEFTVWAEDWKGGAA